VLALPGRRRLPRHSGGGRECWRGDGLGRRERRGWSSEGVGLGEGGGVGGGRLAHVVVGLCGDRDARLVGRGGEVGGGCGGGGKPCVYLGT
jgi:hypothetical protein